MDECCKHFILTMNYLFLLVPFIMGTLVLGRLDLDPEPDPSPSPSPCTGSNCASDDPSVHDPPVFTCNDTETSFHPDLADCHSYYICHKGNSTHQTCPPEMAYRRIEKICVHERFVRECHELVNCEETYNGFVPDSKNCTRYYRCFYGYPYHFTCSNGTRFDPVSRRCSSTVPCITDKGFRPPVVDLGGAHLPAPKVSTFVLFKNSKWDINRYQREE